MLSFTLLGFSLLGSCSGSGGILGRSLMAPLFERRTLNRERGTEREHELSSEKREE